MKEKPSSDDQRTSLAKSRTVMANERTLMAYLRTSLAVAGLGAFILKFYPTQASFVISIILFTLGLFILIYGIVRYNKFRKIIHGEN